MPFHFNSSKAEEKVTDILKIFSFFRIIISYFDFLSRKAARKRRAANLKSVSFLIYWNMAFKLCCD